MWKANEVRQSFLDFFASKGHKITPSAPVIPHGDPTLLFTNAGMNQFKDIFLGEGDRGFTRATDTQKCIRVSGKHNDLEQVGVDTYHHTFFEMLGNWSFGDYYKEEAIEWAWELLTEAWSLDKERLFATVFRTDDEAYEIWKKYLPEDRIYRFDEKDNFWEMGETGPCGPCSEIHYDRTEDKNGGKLINKDVPEVIEIWNLVFIQYNRKKDGTLEELKSKHVDTGMGFERIVSVLQGKASNYDTDVFMPLINKIEELSGGKYTYDMENTEDTAMRVIADHVRALAFSIADGALPGNEGRGYVLRRILRRASRYAKNLGFTEPIIYKLIPTLIDAMGDFFDELKDHQTTIEKTIKAEEVSFLQTLERGLEKFEGFKERALKSEKILKGSDAFLLYDTFGFPLDLTRLIAREHGIEVDERGFDENMKRQKKRSREARKTTSQEAATPEVEAKSEFVGRETLETEAKVIYAKDNKLVLDKTPFYAESGGQVADTGVVVTAGEEYRVEDVKASGQAIVHFCDKTVESIEGETVLARVDGERRKAIMRNHSATHLLHEALRLVLGEHVKQSGSLVSPDYLRFDFNHFEKLSDEEIKEIETLVNKKILEGNDVETEELSIDEAQKNPKIKMFFGDKYGESVRVVSMDKDYSMELCGGTHVSNTSEIGLFKITEETSVAAGVRRIEAVTGKGVADYIYRLQEREREDRAKVEELRKSMKKMEKGLAAKQVDNTKSQMEDWIDDAKEVGGVKVVAKKIEAGNMDQLRTMGDGLRNALKENGIGLLAIELDGKAQLVCVVTDDLKKKAPAGKIVGKAAKILGGGGGGKPHIATAGGKRGDKIPELIEKFPDVVEEFISG